MDFCHSVISDLTNDHADRTYQFYDNGDENYLTGNIQSHIDRVANFKTNFTVVEDSESKSGYKVSEVDLRFINDKTQNLFLILMYSVIITTVV